MAETSKKTNNSYLGDKVALRVRNLPKGKRSLSVMDCYSGKGLIWRAVKRLSGVDVVTLPIDIKEKEGFHLPGDNLAWMESIDFNRFDVIDLDAYGVPFEQLKLLFERNYKGVVFVTFIQTMYGQLPYGMLNEIGFSTEMIEKIPTLFGESGWQYFLEWLAKNGVTKIVHRSNARKHYLAFSCAEARGAG